jgi:hypothetical protein
VKSIGVLGLFGCRQSDLYPSVTYIPRNASTKRTCSLNTPNCRLILNAFVVGFQPLAIKVEPKS